MWVRSLGQEDALEEEMATHSSILAWKIPWTEDPGGLLSMGSQRVGCDVVTKPPKQKAIINEVHLIMSLTSRYLFNKNVSPFLDSNSRKELKEKARGSR